MAPACSRRSIRKALSVAMLLFHSGLPKVVGRPANLKDSLTVIGIPRSGPQRSPRARAASAARARSRAWSACQTTIAFSAGLCRSAPARLEVEQFDAPDAAVANFNRQIACGSERAIVHVPCVLAP